MPIYEWLAHKRRIATHKEQHDPIFTLMPVTLEELDWMYFELKKHIGRRPGLSFATIRARDPRRR